MSLPLLIGALWVLASAIVALLPMRHQYAPGICLLIAAPVLIVWIGAEHGWVPAAFGLFAFLSMFRRPLIYFAKKALGHPVSPPLERPE
ncbi:DUF2484 family protein [Ovoidimarina sediminis]|uniref:DUF2484 family protein n=1 Tax=Ovoidimarina sediminis TaxID=3079856 RepID=UPI002915A30A|nr:DUF2484 family protein [Rhodophyticola sp. MJ-SS7]MDU8943096.1 DUF2484 family protein [Rhodophyticola sp. MJ-SS7]